MFYKRHIFIFLGSLVAIWLVVADASAQLVEDSANRKVLKVRSDLLRGDATRKFSGNQLQGLNSLGGQISGRATCGAVDIGNQHVSSTFSGEINVIVTGDIVNTGNNCR